MKSKQYKSYWYLDLLGMIASGLIIGYERQRFADSGQFNPYKIVQSMLISSFAYLIVFLVFLKFNKSQTVWKVPNWVLMAITGAISCFFSLHIVKFALDNWQYRKSDSVLEYLQMVLPNMIIGLFVISFIYSIVTLFILGAFRLPLLLFNSKQKTYP